MHMDAITLFAEKETHNSPCDSLMKRERPLYAKKVFDDDVVTVNLL